MMEQDSRPDRRVSASAVILCGLALTNLVLPTDNAVEIFASAAIGVGLSLALATGIEATAGVRGLIRVDILMLWLLYAFTLVEFLFPQPNLDEVVTAAAAVSGTDAVLVGFAGLVVGRHVIPRSTRSNRRLSPVRLRTGDLFLLFMFATLVGYLHILLAVNFDPFEMLRQMSWPRFSQAWSRGRYGDVYSLLYELGMLIYLIPPIAGLIYARAREFKSYQKLTVAFILALTGYYGFASGTRSVLATYAIMFAGAYFLAKPRIKLGRVLLLGIPMLVLLLIGAIFMLEFRTVGLGNFSFDEHQYDTLYIDRNIVNISQLTEVFPGSIDFLGLEVPFNALIRPIPRAIWADKPEGLSTSIEAALGENQNMTLSCTFVGEAYMAGGFLAVLLAGLLFGAAAEMWNRVGRDIESPFAQLLYASGLLCAAIAMRSMLSMVPLMLPTLALWLYGRIWLPRSPKGQPVPLVRPNKL